MRTNYLFLAIASVFIIGMKAQHTLHLKSGDEYVGKLISIMNDKVAFQAESGERRFFTIENVSSLNFNELSSEDAVPISGNLNDKPEVATASVYNNTDPDIKEEYITFEDKVSTSAKGVSFIMTGRKLIRQPKDVINTNREYGRVVVEVNVDKYGNVKGAKAGAPGSNTSSKYLHVKAEQTARSMKFDTGFDYPIDQTGYIIVDFE